MEEGPDCNSNVSRGMGAARRSEAKRGRRRLGTPWPPWPPLWHALAFLAALAVALAHPCRPGCGFGAPWPPWLALAWLALSSCILSRILVAYSVAYSVAYPVAYLTLMQVSIRARNLVLKSFKRSLSKLTREIVTCIRVRYATGYATEYATEYATSMRLVCNYSVHGRGPGAPRPPPWHALAVLARAAALARLGRPGSSWSPRLAQGLLRQSSSRGAKGITKQH